MQGHVGRLAGEPSLRLGPTQLHELQGGVLGVGVVEVGARAAGIAVGDEREERPLGPQRQTDLPILEALDAVEERGVLRV